MPKKEEEKKAPESGNSRAAHYLAPEHREGPHPAVNALSQRPATRSENGRKVSEYTRIERGRET